MTFQLDATQRKLLSIYKRAYVQLLRRLHRQQLAGLSQAHTISLLRDVDRILQELDADAIKWIEEVFPEVYRSGSEAALEEIYHRYGALASEGVEHFKFNTKFGAVHQYAVERLAMDTYADLAGATKNMSDRLKESIRLASERVFVTGTVTGETRIQMTRKLVEALQKEGFTQYLDERGRRIKLADYKDVIGPAGRPLDFKSGEFQAAFLEENWVGFVDKAGRRWDLFNYAEMLTRTKVTEAESRGTEDRLVANGLDLVQITSHGAEDWCSFYEGKVFSISGKHPVYPPLAQAPNGGTPFHPRCKHREAPFIEKFHSAEELEAAKTDPSLLGKNKTDGTADHAALNKIYQLNRAKTPKQTNQLTEAEEISGKEYLGKIENFTPLGGGASETHIGTVDGKKYVFKADEPVAGLDMLSSNAEGEILASKIFNRFGLPAPEVQYGIFDANGTKKTLMAFDFVENALSPLDFLSTYGYGSVQLEQFRKMQVLDLLIGNGDRHDGNIFLTSSGAIIPIDHNLAFATNSIIKSSETWQKCFLKTMNSLASHQTPQHIFLRNRLGRTLYNIEGISGYDSVVQQIQKELTDAMIKEMVGMLAVGEQRKQELIEILIWRRDNLQLLINSI